MSTQITYADVAEGQADFVIPFDYLKVEDLIVLVDGVAVSFTVPTQSIARLETETDGGENVTVRRATDIDDPWATFTSVVTTSNLNNQILQLLYAAQELDTRITSLNLDELDPDYVPPATATDKVLLSAPDGSGGFEWTVVDRTSILDFTVPNPSGEPDDSFLVTDTNSYALKSLDDVRNLLTSGGSLPTVDQANAFVTSNPTGDGYQLSGQAAARSLLGLGTAAVKNAGTSVGNVLVIDDDGNYGGVAGTPALPAINAGGLAGVGIIPEYGVFRRVLDGGGYDSGLDITDVSNANDYIAQNTDVLLRGAFAGTAPSWATAFDEGSTGVNNGVTIIEEGTYIFTVSACIGTDSGSNRYELELDFAGGLTTSIKGLMHFPTAGGNNSSIYRSGVTGVHTMVAIPSSTDVRVYLRNADGYAAGLTTGSVAAILHMTKVA